MKKYKISQNYNTIIIYYYGININFLQYTINSPLRYLLGKKYRA